MKYAICPLSHDDYPAALTLFEAAQEAKPAGSRMSPASIAGLCLMASGEVRFARDAARIAGITETNFSRSRRSKHGRTLEKSLSKLYRQNAGQMAVRRIVELSEQQENLSVAMRASQWLAEINGVSPTAKSEVTHKSEAVGAGMMVIHPDAATPELLEAIFPSPNNSAPVRH